MTTESQKLREKGNAVYKTLSDDIAPVVRRGRLENCLQFYNQARASSYLPADEVAALKNLGMASYKMFQLLDEAGENDKLVNFYVKETFGHFSQALEKGGEQSREWRQHLYEKVNACLESWIAIVDRMPSEGRVGAFERLVRKMPECVKTAVNLELADALFKCAVKQQEVGNLRKCLHFLHECYRPLEEAKHYCGTDDHQQSEIRVIEEDVFIQKCVAEARKAIQTGDDLLQDILVEEECVNIDMLWAIVDWFQQAIILSQEKDLEIEAIACSRLGYIYDKILMLKWRAKERFRYSFHLVTALHPRVFTTEDWYQLMTQTLARYQQEVQRAEEEKWENKRKKYVEELKPELDELKKFCDARRTYTHDKTGMKNVKEVLEFVYKRFPPKNPKHTAPTIDIEDEYSVKKAYQKAVTHYHPDRQKEEYGIKWKVLAEEVCKELTQRYEYISCYIVPDDPM